MRTARDPELMSLAHRLDQIEFTHSLTPDEEKKLAQMWLLKGRAKGAPAIPKVGTWFIQVFLGGALRTVGRIKNKRGKEGIEKAARYSDMARCYFSHYRHFPSAAPDLNLSVERATEDLKNETLFVQLLKDIEACLLRKKVILAPGEQQTPMKLTPAAVYDFKEAISQLAARVINGHTSIAEQFALVKNAVIEESGMVKSIGVFQHTQGEGIVGMLNDTAKRLTDIESQQAVIIQILQTLAMRLIGMNTVTIVSGTAGDPMPIHTTCEQKDKSVSAPLNGLIQS